MHILWERRGLSKEHLWPDWLSKMYVRSGNEKHTFGSRTHMNKEMTHDGVYERPGLLYSLKIRVVCQSCNNGWMSQVENETKPILLRMINGESHKIKDGELATLSFWVVMKVITAEFSEKSSKLHVTPVNERRAMMEERKIPNFFNIFLGVHSTGHNSAWHRHSWTMSLSPKGPTPPLERRERNAQSIAFILGPIFIYILNVRLQGFNPEQHFKFGKMIKIHPSKRHFLRWPQKPLKKIETDVIAFMSQDLTESHGVKFIPEIPTW